MTLLLRSTVDELMSFQFEERGQEVWESARIKWKARKEHSMPDFGSKIEEEETAEFFTPVNYKSF